jgi:copper(I)-binding protein
MLFRAIVAAFSLMATSAAADPPVVTDPVIFKAFSAARVAAGYLTVDNSEGAADRLIGVRIEGPMAMIHESREVDGVMTMPHIDAIEVEAGETVSFAPGGYHIMIMGISPDEFAIGDIVPITLVFDKAGEVAVDFSVTERPEIK